jgi:predicted MFS family arabinose efflux permease
MCLHIGRHELWEHSQVADADERSVEDSHPHLPSDFTLLWSGSATSQLGSMSAAIAIPLLALSLTHSPVFAGWVAAAGTFPSLLLHLPAGLLVDWFDRRRIMLTCQYARFVISLLLVLGLLVLADPSPLLIIAAAADGTLAALFNLAEVTVIRRIVPHSLLPAAMSKNEARSHIALLLGRPLGGFLYDVSRVLPFAADAVSSLFSAIVLGAMKAKDFQIYERQSSSVVTEFRKCRKYLWEDPFLRTVLVVCAITNFAFQTIFLLLIVQADREIASGSKIGILFAASGLGGVLGALAAPRILRRRKPTRMVLVCVWGWVAMTATMMIWDRPLVGLAAWGAISFIGAHMNVALAVYQATWIPDDLLAKVSSINSFITRGAVPLGSLFAGYILSMLHSTRVATSFVTVITLSVALGVTLQSFIGRARFFGTARKHTSDHMQ